jgi:hypothetical protein
MLRVHQSEQVIEANVESNEELKDSKFAKASRLCDDPDRWVDER